MDTAIDSAGSAKKAELATRIDVACVRDKSLLVYGWVLGLGSNLVDATITIDSVTVSLNQAAVLVPRPDVSASFKDSFSGKDDRHGFYAMIDLPLRAQIENLHLTLTDIAGTDSSGTDWPIVSDDESVTAAIERLSASLTTLSRKLPVREQRRLSRFCRSDFGLEQTLPPTVRAGIDACCVIEDKFLFVYGWLRDPHDLVSTLNFTAGDTSYDLLQSAQVIPPPPPDPNQPEAAGSMAQRRGFALGTPLRDGSLNHDEFGLEVDCGDGPVFLWKPAVLEAGKARGTLAAFLESMDAGSSMLIVNGLRDRTAGVAIPRSFGAWLDQQHRAAVARLPAVLNDATLGVDIHVDWAVRVGTTGLFLIGWVKRDPAMALKVECVCGSERFDLGTHWLESRRPDVLKHLVKEGSATAEFSAGFACFVPISDGDAAYYLEITVPGLEVARVRLEVPSKPPLAIDTVQSILTSFSAVDWEVGALLDRHVGRAVQAAWSARGTVQGEAYLRRFGDPAPAPVLSIIVPLFGRFDLAEYQLALFADDPAFAANELIYVVDDPAIFDEFRLLCPHLYATYGVPFVLAYPGANLGFSGANNHATAIARGEYLLLMNSDVFPKTPDFLTKLAETYRSLPDTGVLGVKLLFEDGSLQHAGIEFRQSPSWDDMWINHHPLKGLNPAGLGGVQDVAAVTAACALIETKLYRAVGGLAEDYIVGDFEDSDLCLKARKAGRTNRIALDIELYHLERQSQNKIGTSHWRSNLTLYNCWVHDRRWHDFIAGLPV